MSLPAAAACDGFAGRVQDMTDAKHFDLIKLDVEGEEKYLMEDPGSKAVLCEATCVFMELHERFVPGCDAAFNEFMKARPPLHPV